MIKLAVSGCQGRMGQRITSLALKDKTFKLSAMMESKGRPDVQNIWQGMPVHFDASALKGSDVLIEFTTPEATLEHLKACQKYGVKMVIGTTGMLPGQIAQVKKAAQKIPIVFSSNMSVGVNIVFSLIQKAAKATGKGYVITIKEAHHIHKKDAPSGTAKTMATLAEEAAGIKVADIQAIREGEIIGDHDITFDSAVDTITIRHHAKTRDIFAEGSLVAAKFLARKKKGLFSMQDVLGLK
ncbi:MAG: 4-hydroxy-tetrahydrodipicolinate reductase [Candidatus Omnitrophota bacterium]|nr:4-hydroxy-tetrahydrodipicolinate reductase [Candidatus Omnitrophota bacterium]MDZ4241243.1 4-hydroxy-tetrahydrodipicolinate reductase [Candidatus Omnitrophota bacterium]